MVGFATRWAIAWVVALGATASCECGRSSQRPEAAAHVQEVPATAELPPEAPPPPLVEEDSAALAKRLAHRIIILDGHIDVPWRLEKSRREDGSLGEDVTGPTTAGDFDLPRAQEGGLDAPFMSIYVSAKYEKRGAKKVADRLIDLVEGIVASAPGAFALARTPEDVRRNFEAGRISLPMGMENGAPIEGKLANVRHFYDRGIRYITLAHSKDNHISDSSYDSRHTHHGLSKFGTKVVTEMNRLGIMVDVSHLSDEAFWDVLDVSVVPVIASHSSCRHFTPGWERNMSDEMIEALAAKGGVIQINFGSDFLDGEISKGRKAHDHEVERRIGKAGLKPDDAAASTIRAAYAAEHPAPKADIGRVADHIEHVIALVGIDHVGLGSDFDGVGDSLPTGLEDVSKYSNLIAVLLERGHSPTAIEQICSGNVLRVWAEVEAHGAAHRQPESDKPLP